MKMKSAAVMPTLVSRYLEVLTEEGFRPQVVSDEDEDGPTIINFKAEGEAFLLFVEDGDPHFFHLGSGYELGDLDVAAAVSRANDVNEELKCVKVTVWAPDHSIRIHVEGFIDEPPVSIDVLERSVGAIQNAARKFFEQARAPDRLDA
jgi:hypothetical protein